MLVNTILDFQLIRGGGLALPRLRVGLYRLHPRVAALLVRRADEEDLARDGRQLLWTFHVRTL